MISRAAPRTSCAECPARSKTAWAQLPREGLADLDGGRVELELLPGEEVHRRGEPCEGLFCLRKGTVALRQTDPGGSAIITRLVHAGETLGPRAYFADEPHADAAVPLVRARVCFIRREVVDRLLASQPGLAAEFLRRMARTLRAADAARLEWVARTLQARLGGALLDLARRSAGDRAEGSLEFDLPLSRRDLAALLGVRPESVARGIRALTDTGLARFAGRRVTIPDLGALEERFGR